LASRLRSLRLCRPSGVDSIRGIAIAKIMAYFMSKYSSVERSGAGVQEPPKFGPGVEGENAAPVAHPERGVR